MIPDEINQMNSKSCSKKKMFWLRLSLINTVMVFNSQVQTENSSKLFVFFPSSQQPGQPHQQVLRQHRLIWEWPFPQTASRGQQQRGRRRWRGAVHQVCAAGPHLAADGQHRRQGHDDLSAACQVQHWAKWHTRLWFTHSALRWQTGLEKVRIVLFLKTWSISGTDLVIL